jgi:sugar phosphate isomerase/epimerase
MRRRQFFATGAALTAALAQPKWASALKPDNKYRNEIGIQLYTLRNEINNDVAGTMKAVADAGYKQVEPYGFPNADDMIREAKANGMAVNSSHINTDGILFPERKGVQPFGELVEKANEMGLTHLVVPYLGTEWRDSADKYKTVAERCNVAAEKAKAAGIQLAYHNHSFEFKPLDRERCGYDIFMEEFSEDMKFEIDVFWVAVADQNINFLIRQLSGRVTQLHLKDLDRSVSPPVYDSIPEEAFKELGNGVIDMEPIIEEAAEAGVAHCHVEQDHSPHPIKSVQQSMAYLKTL